MKPPLIKNLGAPKKSMDDGPKQNFLCPFDEFLGLCQRPSYCTKPSRVKFLHGKFTFPHFSIPTTLKNLWRTFSENLVGSAFSSSITTTLSSQFFRILMRKFSRKTRIIVLFGALIQNSLVNPNQIKWIVTFLVHPTSHFSVKYNQKSMKKCVVLAACSVLILCVNC